MISSLLHHVGLRPRAYYTLTNFRVGGQGPLAPPPSIRQWSFKIQGEQSPPRNTSSCSGVVGQERMGTAFPHKKLSGSGVPTRRFLRDIFLIFILN